MSVATKALGAAITSEAIAPSLRGFISTANDVLKRSSGPGNTSETAAEEDVKKNREQAAAIELGNRRNGRDVPLLGKRAAIKDNICTKTTPQLPTTCDSKILGPGFLSPYNATVVELLGQAGCDIVGKTSMDEFGMGSHSIHTSFGEVYLEDSQGRRLSVGGSSGGSAVAVKDGSCDFALGTDTGGSVRLPAAYTGVVGFKPSYGLLSRWGVIAYANSLDTVGILGRSTSIVQQVFGTVFSAYPPNPADH